MGLIDSMKNAVRGAGEWLRSYPLGYQRTTPASCTAESLGRERMVHVSKAVPQEAELANKLGLPGVAAEIMRRTKGVTYYSPARHVKRKADELAAELGLNNKARLRLRRGMVRRLAEMEAQNG